MEPNKTPGQNGKSYLLIGIALVLFFIISPFSSRALASTNIRFLHLAPGTGPVEIWIDGRLIKQSLNFREHTNYVEISSEQHRVISKTMNGPNTVVLNSPFPFRENKEYTVLVTGGRKRKDLQLLFTVDNCPPNANLAQIKFINSVQDSPPANVSIKYGPTLYSDLAFRMGGGCRLIPSDNYRFQLVETRTGKLIAEQDIDLKAGTRYNIFATETEEGNDVELLYLTKPNVPEEVPKIFGIERSVLQLLGAGLIASLVILVIGR